MNAVDVCVNEWVSAAKGCSDRSLTLVCFPTPPQEQHPRIPGAWTREVDIITKKKAVGGLPMHKIETATTLGLVGFEVDLRAGPTTIHSRM